MGVSGLEVAAPSWSRTARTRRHPVAIVERGFAAGAADHGRDADDIAELARERDVQPPAVVVDRLRRRPARVLGLTISRCRHPPPLVAVAHGSRSAGRR